MSKEVEDIGMVLKIGHLYPTLMSVAADRGNLYSIQKRCQWRGIAVEIEQIFVKQTPDFTRYDLILFHGGGERGIEMGSRGLPATAAPIRGGGGPYTALLSRFCGVQTFRHYYKTVHGPKIKNPWV